METIELLKLSMINQIKVFIQGVRLRNIFIALLCCLITLHKIDNYQVVTALISIIIIILLMISSNLINDIYDIKTDSINKPNRALIKNPEKEKGFQGVAFFCSFAALLLALFLNYKAFLIIVFSLPILILYTPVFKGIPLVGNVIVAFYLSLVFIFIELSLTGDISIMIVPAIFAFGISLIREIIKDVEDYKGDQLAGLYTLSIYMGISRTIKFIILLIICFLIFCTFMILEDQYFYYTISVFLLVFMPLFYLIFFLIKSPTSEACRAASALLKKITILGLIIIYII